MLQKGEKWRGLVHERVEAHVEEALRHGQHEGGPPEASEAQDCDAGQGEEGEDEERLWMGARFEPRGESVQQAGETREEGKA